jgi:hypothetical protein
VPYGTFLLLQLIGHIRGGPLSYCFCVISAKSRDRVTLTSFGVRAKITSCPSHVSRNPTRGCQPLNSARTLLAAVAYLAIVLALWLPFTLYSGFPYETGFIYTSEISTWWNGFLNGHDRSRIYESLFYQAAYLTGVLSGFAGSFVPYEIVYAALWWARAFLVFLIGRRLAPDYDVFWYLAGALVLVHASDNSIGWAGQLNHFGYMFWMLAGFYMLLLAVEQTQRRRFLACLLLAAFFEHLSLWSYESELLIVLIAPIFLLIAPATRRKRLPIVLAWYVVPVIYAAAAVLRYARPSADAYQPTVVRKAWSFSSILNDWLFNIDTSLRFWRWPETHPANGGSAGLKLACVLALVAFIGGIIVLAWFQRKGGSPLIPARRTLWTVVLSGFLLLVLSFPAYLILSSARSLWRTQILSGLGAALIFAAAIVLCATVARRRWVQIGIMVLLALPIAGYGSFSALTKAAYHRSVWERHRGVMAGILRVAPRLRSGTLVVLTGVPKDAARDPFLDDNQWFDLALRLAYPGTSVAGIYFDEDGHAAPESLLTMAPGGNWIARGDFFRAAGDARAILVLELDGAGGISVAQSLPSFLHVDEKAARLYNPRGVIESGEPSPRAGRRYLGSAKATYAP